MGAESMTVTAGQNQGLASRQVKGNINENQIVTASGSQTFSGEVHPIILSLLRFRGAVDSWTLPIPGRFVVDQDGVIAYSEVDPDQTHRSNPSDLLPVAARHKRRWLRPSGSSRRDCARFRPRHNRCQTAILQDQSSENAARMKKILRRVSSIQTWQTDPPRLTGVAAAWREDGYGCTRSR